MVYVNGFTSKEERVDKYAVCRAHGIPPVLARVMRNWRWQKIIRHIGKDALYDINSIELYWRQMRDYLRG